MKLKLTDPDCQVCGGTGEVVDRGPSIAPYPISVVFPCCCLRYVTETRWFTYGMISVLLPLAIFFYCQAMLYGHRWAFLGVLVAAFVLMAIVIPTEYLSMKNRHKREWAEMEHQHAEEMARNAAFRAWVVEHSMREQRNFL
jgi:purine-cytosine permease-like protein